jgi:hypothetical protein
MRVNDLGAIFHRDERAAQRLAGFSLAGASIRSFMPDAHREFFAGLGYLFVGVVDEGGWPVATVVSGPPGFVASPDATTLSVAAAPGADDPARAGWRLGAPIGLLGLDFSTRRRNRANGVVAGFDCGAARLAIEQSFGNCAKYIQRREARPTPRRAGRAEPLAALDGAARDLLARADAAFVASRSRDESGPASGADVSHRGGPPGFLRLDGDTLAVPDYPGNRYMNTLGNLLGEPRASLLAIDFDNGDVLQLQGRAEIDWRPDAARALPGAERLWRLRVERAWRRPAALPIAWTFLDAAPTTQRIAEIGLAAEPR